MKPRIAIPLPTSHDLAYNEGNWRSYASAVEACGGEPVAIALDLTPRQIIDLAESCHAVLLPGSPADVNPGKYGQQRQEGTALADAARENVDELLLQDAHNLYKPILGICFGAQMLNVWRSGTLVQDLTILPVNHAAARGVAVAHSIVVARGSLLEQILAAELASAPEDEHGLARLGINSSHHQAVGIAGDGLRVSARSVEDSVVEAIEGGQANSWDRSGALGPAHFVLGVQWHPERTFDQPASRAIFARFLREASLWTPREVTTSVAPTAAT